MKRSGFTTRQREPMRRTSRLRRAGHLRAKRRKPGVTGRPSVSPELWTAIRRALWLRARGRCEVPYCRTSNPPLDPHHIQKKSQGGDDSLWNLTLLCRAHHEETDAPYVKGRLVVRMIEEDGEARPRFQLEYKDPRRTA